MAASMQQVVIALKNAQIIKSTPITGSTYDSSTLVGVSIELSNGKTLMLMDESIDGTGGGNAWYVTKTD